MAYHDHSDDRAVSKISACLAAGGSVALVSDAGTIVVAHYSGLTVADMTALRAQMREAGAGVRVAFDLHEAKNGLIHRADVRAVGLYPSAPGGQLMLMYGVSFDPRR